MLVKEYGYEYDATVNDALLKRTENSFAPRSASGAMLLRSGRDALKVVAREYENLTVLMPALACESMVLPFEQYGHMVKFYRLNPDYTIDMVDVSRLASQVNGTILFVFMDYFGCKATDDTALENLQKSWPSMVFLEDRTHNLLVPSNRNFRADYVVASLRKWTNVPDGGLLWSSCPVKNDTLGYENEFFKQRLYAQSLRHTFFRTGDNRIKEEYRSIFSQVSNIMDCCAVPVAMSAYTFEMASKTNWTAIREIRRINAEVLLKILKVCPKIEIIQPQTGDSDLYVAFLVDDRDRIQRELSRLGIFCTIIWPLSKQQEAACPVARDTCRRMLAAPCDQRYGVRDMEYIGKEIVRIINE